MLQSEGIFCQTSCSHCSKQQAEFPFAYIHGEFLLAAFFPVHFKSSNILNCSEKMRPGETIELLEPALYSVDVFNNPKGMFKDSPISGKLGIVIFDTCQNPIHAANTLANFQTGLIQLKDPHGNIYPPSKLIGVIGSHYSSESMRIGDIVQGLNLIQCSYASTSTELFKYKHFIRTIPADDMQTKAIVEVIKALKWNAFSIVYVDDPYGIAGYSNMVIHAKKAGICVARSIKASVYMAEDEVNSILEELYRVESQSGVRVVVLFTHWEESYALLKTASTKRFVWIGAEGWRSQEEFIRNEEVKIQALGALTIMAHSDKNEDLTDYMVTLKPRHNERNPFFDQWFENKFECHLSNSKDGYFSSPCGDRLNLSTVYEEDIRASKVVNAVLSVASGLGETLKTLCQHLDNCDEIRTQKGLSKILNAVKNIKLPSSTKAGKQRVFTDRGDGIAEYDIYNIQPANTEEGEMLEYVQVSIV